MLVGRDSRGHFIKGNVPWNKRQANPRIITFTCKFCAQPKPIDELRVAMRFFPPLPVCQGCWKLLEAPPETITETPMPTEKPFNYWPFVGGIIGGVIVVKGEAMKFYVDLMKIISDIVNSAKGETPDWARLELKAEDLRVLALKAQVAHGYERGSGREI